MEGGQKKGRRLLQSEAYAILNDYFVNVSQWPDPAAQEDLAERVRCVKGCEFYTARQVYSYFANNRAKIRSGGSGVALPTGDSLRRGPRKVSRGDQDLVSSRPLSNSAAPHSVIQKIDVLLDDEPDPSPEMVEVWAERLGDGVVAEYILTYAFLRRASTYREAESETQARPSEQHPESSVATLLGSPGSGSSRTVSLDASIDPPPRPCSQHAEAAPHVAPPIIIPPPPISANNDDEQLGEKQKSSAAPSHHQPAPHPPSKSCADGVLAPRATETENANAHVAAGAGIPVSAATSPSAETVRPDELVQRVRAALLEADARGTRESPKTFVDFARWLEGHNADCAAVLGLHAATATATARA